MIDLFAIDKLIHITASIIISIILSIKLSYEYSYAVSLTVGVLKEIWDLYSKLGNPEVGDIVADIIGISIGLFIIFIYRRLK